MESSKTKDLNDLFPTSGIRCGPSGQEALLIDEIQKALSEANNGDFASTDEVRAVVNKWITNIS
ncbi:hypothetical protein D3C81_206570 [compost metagenome]